MAKATTHFLLWGPLLAVLPMIALAIGSGEWRAVPRLALMGYFLGAMPALLAGVMFAGTLVWLKRRGFLPSMGGAMLVGAIAGVVGAAIVTVVMMARFGGPTGEGAIMGLVLLMLPAVFAGALTAVPAWIGVRRAAYFTDNPSADDVDQEARVVDTIAAGIWRPPPPPEPGPLMPRTRKTVPVRVNDPASV
ncbi:hypothetical protein RBI14_24040 [Alcaligenaceae bacterium B3P038]|nr:hypothetical protein [Alcaligenaceae bacterium B3P038]